MPLVALLVFDTSGIICSMKFGFYYLVFSGIILVRYFLVAGGTYLLLMIPTMKVASTRFLNKVLGLELFPHRFLRFLV